jgi:hypothetical protein
MSAQAQTKTSMEANLEQGDILLADELVQLNQHEAAHLEIEFADYDCRLPRLCDLKQNSELLLGSKEAS